MDFKRKAFSLSLIILALIYPVYEAVEVAISGDLGDHCRIDSHRPSGTGVGAYCSFGIRLGETLFGVDRSYLGYSLLLAVTVLAFGLFAFWLVIGNSDKTEK